MKPALVSEMVSALEAKDFSTAAHTWRVVLYTRALADDAGLDHDQVDRLSYAAALHDIGKIDIPDEILRKPGPLTGEEFALMRTHAARGHERLVAMGETDPVLLQLVRHHHERIDGRGYPDGLSGDGVPLAAAFFAVIDSFDAMTSVRPYRSAVGPEAARLAVRELHEHAGSRYLAEAVKRFSRLHDAGHLTWIMEYYNDTCAVPAYDDIARLREITPLGGGRPR
ncbi:MAG: HD domain-containing protein [Planctomycetota bacterium]|nr:HD domain-containing protein [Planctomycetota bacterium]